MEIPDCSADRWSSLHVRTAPTPWKHLQNDDAVPTTIENAFQKNWVKHLAVKVLGSTFPQRNPRLAGCDLVEFQELTAERSPERLRFQPQQLRRIGLGHLHNRRLGDALRDQSFVEGQQSVRMERIVGLTQVG
jgi:hypothetical protein